MEKYIKPMANVINIEINAIMAASPGIETGNVDPLQDALGKEFYDDYDDDL